MAQVGRLNVDLVARTTNFTKGLRSAGASLASFANPLRSVTGLAAAFGASVTAAGSVAFVKSRMDEIDVLAKVADSLGATTEGLIGYRHAANLAGVEGSAFDKSLGRMVVNVADAATGIGTAKDAIKELGLSAKGLGQLTADEQFFAIAGAMERVENQTRRVGLAYDIFGRQGIAMLNVLKDGQKGLMDARMDADKLGLTFSREDAAKVELANDAMTRVGEAIKGAGNQVAIALAPRIEAASNMLTDFVSQWDNLGPAIENVAKTGVKAFALTGAAASKAMEAMKSASQGLSEALVGSQITDLEYNREKLEKSLSRNGSVSGFGVVKDWAQGINREAKSVRIWDPAASKHVYMTLDQIDSRLESLRGSASDVISGALDIGFMDSLNEILGVDLSKIDDFFNTFKDETKKRESMFRPDLDDLDEIESKISKIGNAGVTSSLKGIAFNSQAGRRFDSNGLQIQMNKELSAQTQYLKQLAAHAGRPVAAVAV